jgi:hypothetical protein
VELDPSARKQSLLASNRAKHTTPDAPEAVGMSSTKFGAVAELETLCEPVHPWQRARAVGSKHITLVPAEPQTFP